MLQDRLRGLAPDTQRTYEKHWGHWVDYLQHRDPRLVDSTLIAGFIDKMVYEKQWKVASIKTLLGGLATCYNLLGVSFPYTAKVVQLQLKGIAKSEPNKITRGTIQPS
jgi:hypothetical protein